jgi:hypothetical protein
MRKLMALIAGTFLALAVTSAAAADASRTTSAASGPLVGTWDTGPLPIRKLRAALVADGYTNAKVTAFFKQFGMTKGYEFKLVFYEENGVPFLARKGWDPSKGAAPRNADHWAYTLLPNRRFVDRGTDPATAKIREVFSYSVSGKRLTLSFISLAEPGFSKADLLIDTMLLRASAALPYKRIS